MQEKTAYELLKEANNMLGNELLKDTFGSEWVENMKKILDCGQEPNQDTVEVKKEDLLEMVETIQLYADPGFYHGCGFVFDRPTGGFDEDFSYDENYQRPVPGKLARQTLENISQRNPQESSS